MARKSNKIDYEDLSLEDLGKLLTKEGVRLNRAIELPPVGRVPTRYIAIDRALGGGFPRGRFTEVYGAESSCKTLLVTAAIASEQAAGGNALLIDNEQTFDPEWAAKNGVNLETLWYARPNTAEESWDLLEKFLRTDKVGLIGLDSIANLVPEAELSGEYGTANVGLHARINAQAMRKLNTLLGSRPQTAVILVNQIRGTINPGLGPATTTTGGRAIPFYGSLRIVTRRIEWVKRGEQVTGAEFQADIQKAKLTGVTARSKVNFRVDFEHGLDFAYDILQEGLERGVVTTSGSWYETDVGKFHGEAAILAEIRANLESWRTKLR